jgi:uncharacterized protein (TIGR04255 family)
VRFAPVFAIERREEVAKFQEKLDPHYVAQDPLAPQYGGGIGSGTAPTRPAPSQESVWPFQDPEREWTVSLSSTSLALEAVQYLDFDDFAAELDAILASLHEVFAPRQEMRLGLRYINRIEDQRLEKRGISFFINDELATPVGGTLGQALLRSYCELRFRERASIIVLRHGLIEPSHYLLDLDHFCDEVRKFEPKSIVKRVRKYHELIERLFVWSLSDRYLKELRTVDQ